MDVAQVNPSSKRTAAVLLAIAALLGALALSAATAAPAGAATCPGFRVLHNDRIGAASFPAGSYTITTTTLSCSQTSTLFARFLQDWDGNLPGTWRVTPKGSGKATFSNASGLSFSVARNGREEEENGPSPSGRLCAKPYNVNNDKQLGPLLFEEGQYLIYQPARSLISCRRASVLFTRFLGQMGSRLPFPWRLTNQTATFYKPEHPVRSAFRVEPAGGVR